MELSLSPPTLKRPLTRLKLIWAPPKSTRRSGQETAHKAHKHLPARALLSGGVTGKRWMTLRHEGRLIGWSRGHRVFDECSPSSAGSSMTVSIGRGSLHWFPLLHCSTVLSSLPPPFLPVSPCLAVSHSYLPTKMLFSRFTPPAGGQSDWEMPGTWTRTCCAVSCK